MRKPNSPKIIVPPPHQIRLVAGGMLVALLLLTAFTLYSYWNHLIPIFGRIYRTAPVVETPYLAFGLLMAPPAIVILFVASLQATWTGKKFDPPTKSKLFKFQNIMLSTSIKILLYVVPTVMILTTLVLVYRDYSPCPKLKISGSAWQLFWVNDESVCFKPDHYINDNWPCKIVDGQEVCIQVDGR